MVFTPEQQAEFIASAINEDVLKLNVSTLDLSWTSQNQGGVEVENDDILTAIELLNWEIDRNNGAAITSGQRKKLGKMVGGWHTLPFYGLADRQIVDVLRFKPTVPPIGANGKPNKYLGAVGAANRGYLPNIPDVLWDEIAESFGVEKSGESYGQWLLDNPSVPVLIPEGEKKTLSSTSIGVPSVGINGCDAGYVSISNEDGSEKSLELISDLKALAAGGRDIYLALDRDPSRKTENRVSQSRKKLAQLLYEAGAGRVFSIQWEAKTAKGLDDFIVAEGAGGLTSAIETAFEIPREKVKEGKEKTSIPSALYMSGLMVDGIFADTRFDASTKQWWRYDNAGKWVESSDEYIFGEAQKFLREVLPDFNPSYVENCVKFSRTYLLCEKWIETSSLLFLPFTNGVLNLKTNELLPHSPYYGFKWQLPRDYSVIAGNWDTIDKFLDDLCNGNQELKAIAIAWSNAVLKGRSDLQKFLYLFGSGANGKGTFTNLLRLLIGSENTHASTMGDLNGNRFEAANLAGKRLMIMTDEDKRIGGVGVFKAVTGGDPIRYERKGKNASNFIFTGMAVVSANTPTFVGDSSYAINRRKVDFPCGLKVEENARRDILPELEKDLTAFTTYLLSIPDDWVTTTIRNAGNVEAVKRLNWEMTTREDSIAAFFDERLILDCKGSIASGQLYKTYRDFCDESGLMPKSQTNFSPALLGLVNDNLSGSIFSKRNEKGILFVGLRFRETWEQGEECRVMQGHVGLNVGLNPIPSKENVGYVGLFDSIEKLAENNPNIISESDEKNNMSGDKKDIDREVDPNPTYPTFPAQDKGLNPTSNPTFTPTLDPTWSQIKRTRFNIGDKVKYIGTDKASQQQYSGVLTVRSITRDVYSCLKSDDSGVTTWLDFEDLEAIE